MARPFLLRALALARSGIATGGSLFRLSNPVSFRWAGTTSTPPLQLTWQAGTLFDNVFDAATGAFVPFRIVSGGSSEPGAGALASTAVDLPVAAEPADGEPAQKPDGSGEGPAAGGPDPASVPGPLPMVGVAVAFRCSRRLRQRLRQGR